MPIGAFDQDRLLYYMACDTFLSSLFVALGPFILACNAFLYQLPPLPRRLIIHNPTFQMPQFLF